MSHIKDSPMVYLPYFHIGFLMVLVGGVSYFVVGGIGLTMAIVGLMMILIKVGWAVINMKEIKAWIAEEKKEELLRKYRK